MRNLERLFKALANRRRLVIMQYLKAHRQVTVGDIAAFLRLSISATSRHLSLLASAELVESEQRSLQVYYRLSVSRPKLIRAVDTIC
ncbi:MAG: metalloregulator ArsR/SmtB family transcription factor [Candidatus Veblenbacteria bacterium]|nr:metalloregulator ArsR/SmtB family transcription factor [Candidatus Veblenbacteria bacterium]